jgi:hypothetical protein
MQTVFEPQDELVKLNVGGDLFTVSKATLLSQPDSYFTAMISGGYNINDEVFIDRSGVMFELILDFLRDGFVAQDSSINLDKLNREAKYFSLPSLTKAIEALKQQHHSGRFRNVVKQLQNEVLCPLCIKRDSELVMKYTMEEKKLSCGCCATSQDRPSKISLSQHSFCLEWSCCGSEDKDSYLCTRAR